MASERNYPDTASEAFDQVLLKSGWLTFKNAIKLLATSATMRDIYLTAINIYDIYLWSKLVIHVADEIQHHLHNCSIGDFFSYVQDSDLFSTIYQKTNEYRQLFKDTLFDHNPNLSLDEKVIYQFHLKPFKSISEFSHCRIQQAPREGSA